jgi:hypothetical protein
MQEYIDHKTQAISVTVSDRAAGQVLADLKSLLEGLLSNQGEESIIHFAKATIEIVQSNTAGSQTNVGFSAIPYVLVADAAIASVQDQNTHNVDELMDAMTSGDFEYQRLAEARNAQVRAAGSLATTAESTILSTRHTVDLTKTLRRASKKLIYSAILATNPEIALVMAIHSTGVDNIYCHTTVHICYTVRAKPARML